MSTLKSALEELEDKSSKIRFQLTEFELPDTLKLVRFIVSGAYGSVFEVEDVKTKERLVIKKIGQVFESTEHAIRLLREIKLLRFLCPHPNLVSLNRLLPSLAPKSCFHQVNLLFRYEGPDLDMIFRTDRTFSVPEIKSLMTQLLQAVQHMHDHRIVHRDLKPANLLLSDQGVLKVCDFGMARPVSYDGTASSSPPSPSSSHSHPTPPPLFRVLTKYVTSRWYRSPEVALMMNQYGTPVDLWAVGCIFAELLMRQEGTDPASKKHGLFISGHCKPMSNGGTDVTKYSSCDLLHRMFQVLGRPGVEEFTFMTGLDPALSASYLDEFPETPTAELATLFPLADAQAMDLLKRFLVFHPNQRITAREALMHPYIRESKIDQKESVDDIEQKNTLVLDQKYINLELEMEQQLQLVLHSKPHETLNLRPADAFLKVQEDRFQRNTARTLLIHKVYLTENIESIRTLLWAELVADNAIEPI